MELDYQYGIIGAGFGGLVAALRLKESNRNSFVIFEKANELGGTWRDNIYPGCACDVPSPLYSIASEPNPKWTRLFSPQPEILSYLKNISIKNDIEKHIKYNSEIVSMEYNEKEGCWKMTTSSGKITHVKMVIMALGPLNRPIIPKLKGIELFEGKQFHSSQWDTQNKLKGKKVGVIGTGASAIQFVPQIAPIVEQLTVFQRSAAWIADRMDRSFSDKEQIGFEKVPSTQKALREFLYWLLEFRGRLFMGNKIIYNLIEKLALKKLEKEVKDPITRKKLTPDYKLGCKRVLSSDDYLPTFNKENVELITDGIKEITKEGIITNDGKLFPVDTIIYGTGFEAAEFSTTAKFIGINKLNLFDTWRKESMQAFKGTTISGFPNLAIILGPNTGLGHTSVVHMMESQMNYIMDYIAKLEKLDKKITINIKKETQDKYNKKIQSQFKGTVWASGCKSWYLDSNGKNTTLYPQLTTKFREELKKVDWEDYELSVL
jgi:cation diffusion facilitator CzcD-associated flavoprotein CzcO